MWRANYAEAPALCGMGMRTLESHSFADPHPAELPTKAGGLGAHRPHAACFGKPDTRPVQASRHTACPGKATHGLSRQADMRRPVQAS
jgi:hypothetical protein